MMLSFTTVFLLVLFSGLGAATKNAAPGIEDYAKYHEKKQDCVQSTWRCGPCNKYTGTHRCTRKVLKKASWHGKHCGPNTTIKTCPVDCEVTSFTKYCPCSKKCGGGYQVKRRHVKIHTRNGGKHCLSLFAWRKCNTKPCKRDCKQSKWKCGHCNKHYGWRKCYRKTLVHHLHHGKKCGPNHRKKKCNVDCEMNHYGPWSKCSKKCGGGWKTHKRTVKYAARHDGKHCPDLDEKEECNTKPCDRDCHQSPWKCDKCDYYTGKQACYRKTLVAPLHYGKKCGPNTKTKYCKVDCKLSEYGHWSKCSKKCGSGWKKRYRKVVYHPRYGGKPCPDLYERYKCNTKPCDRDCEQTDWKCGDCDYYSGKKKCYRKISVQPLHHGKKCGPNYTTKYCKVDCKVGHYGPWTKCSKKCGGGLKNRTRKVVYHARYGGKECPALYEKYKCNTKPCDRDCYQTPWKCDKCNYVHGRKKCRRKVIHHHLHGGKKCGRNLTYKPCKVDCQVGDYGDWEKCSKKCGGGWKNRYRKVMYHPRYGGKKCPHLYEKLKCNTKPCDRDCEQSDWKCDKCDYYTGGIKCYRKVVVYPLHYGKKCGPNYLEKTCKVDCKVSGYGSWSVCDKKCGGGWSKRYRKVIHGARHGGTKCPYLYQKKPCNTKPCDRDCEQGPWKCGQCDYYSGKKTCYRKILVTPLYYGTKCGPNTQYKPCKVDCKMSAYGYWHKCSKKCGGGWKKRSRKVIYHPKHGGKSCPDIWEKQKCNTKPCDRDCHQGPWICGKCDYYTGKIACYRKTLTLPLHYGKKCGPTSKTKYCKVDCKMSNYGHWSKCSKKCGGGIKTRHRKVVHKSRYGGKKCPAYYEKYKCNTNPCDKDCKQSKWKCGKCNHYTGKKICTRNIMVHPVGYGYKCGRNREKIACKVDCKMSNYGHWSKCSKLCGGGWKMRQRKVMQHARYGGKKCPDLYEKIKCNPHGCLKCPDDSVQFGKINHDVSGKGLVGHLYGLSIEKCQNRCKRHKKCGYFHFFARHGHPKIKKTVCELYPIKAKINGTYGYNSIICKPTVNCEMKGWSHWSKCSKKCGGGSQWRKQIVRYHPRNGGKDCPRDTQKRSCNTHKCKCPKCPHIKCGYGYEKHTPDYGHCPCPKCEPIHDHDDHILSGHMTIAAVGGLVLLAGAIKFFKKDNTNLYEELSEELEVDSSERQQLL